MGKKTNRHISLGKNRFSRLKIKRWMDSRSKYSNGEFDLEKSEGSSISLKHVQTKVVIHDDGNGLFYSYLRNIGLYDHSTQKADFEIHCKSTN